MKVELGDEVRLGHILESIALIEEFMEDVDYSIYMEDMKLRLALVKLLENIGEAAVAISPEIKIKFSEVEWRMLKIVRNILVHEYFGINYNTIWDSIQNDVPLLKDKIQHIIDTKFSETQ